MGTNQEIKSKQVGKNLIVIIDGKKYTKVGKNTEELQPIKNKILLYNKKNSEALKKTIIKLVDKTVDEKEAKAAKKKGLKKGIKKEVKKSSKKKGKKTNTRTLVDTVKEEFTEGNFTDGEIKELEDLLRRKKEAVANKEEPQQEVAKQESSSNERSRERYR